MSKVVRALLWTLAGYAAGVASGLALVTLLSRNSHDKSLEMVMTAVFVAGPVGAVVGLIAALMRRRP